MGSITTQQPTLNKECGAKSQPAPPQGEPRGKMRPAMAGKNLTSLH